MAILRRCALLLAFALSGCHDPVAPVAIVKGAVDHSLAVRVGTVVRIRLQSIGPGEYRSPPQLSSSALRFDEVVLATPYVPAGLTQEFRFTAVAAGRAVVTFTHTGDNPAVVDTVEVQ